MVTRTAAEEAEHQRRHIDAILANRRQLVAALDLPDDQFIKHQRRGLRNTVAIYDKMLREARTRLDQAQREIYMQRPRADTGRRHD